MAPGDWQRPPKAECSLETEASAEKDLRFPFFMANVAGLAIVEASIQLLLVC